MCYVMLQLYTHEHAKHSSTSGRQGQPDHSRVQYNVPKSTSKNIKENGRANDDRITVNVTGTIQRTVLCTKAGPRDCPPHTPERIMQQDGGARYTCATHNKPCVCSQHMCMSNIISENRDVFNMLNTTHKPPVCVEHSKLCVCVYSFLYTS